jgi:Na+/melibiose symporter-like transporter
VDGSRRSIALAINRMADGVHLLVERALDHLDDPAMAAIFARQQNRVADA